MLQRFSLPRILGFLAAVACTCAILGLAAQVAPAKQRKGSGVIVLDAASEQGETGQLPPVAFDHDRHTQGENAAGTCVSCHDPNATSPRTFKDAAGKSGQALEDAFHAGCVSCHEDLKARNMAAGPLQAECRSCHNEAALPRDKDDANRADGGLDASLHARHIASPLIVAAGREENCVACHHPVSNLASPGVKVDSCRSCHLDRADAENTNKPAYADVAHDKCISCHQALAPSGVKAPVTCNSCHNATVRAGYEKLSPVPRLKAGQPDSVRMGAPLTAGDSAVPAPPAPLRGTLPDPEPGAATQPKQSMPPVVFNHKLHESAAESCVSCHHNTLQKCSTCHTPAGSAKGGNVSLATAMHLPSSDLSCIGCHETRKTAQAECAGCHTIMPKAKAGQTNCASCHTPPAKQRAEGPAGNTDKDTAKDLAAVIAASPDKVTIGALANEFEPTVFEHRRHVEKLVEGIREASPGMMRFHAEPYALCASCHHNSPPSAAPPSCASCHTKGVDNAGAALRTNGFPTLKAAYHQQCMSCHTGMGLTKPANTDCASCHAPRAPGR